jgi:HD-like signal output (HDOD) protein
MGKDDVTIESDIKTVESMFGHATVSGTLLNRWTMR